MTSPLPTLFGRHQTKQLDLDRPEGCDHDQNVYHYRLVDGVMVFRGVALGPRWENREMNWQGLSCYKRKEDDRMAKRQAPPYEELRQIFIGAEYKIDRVRKVLKVNWSDAKQWLKDAGLIDGYNRPTEKVTAEPVRSMGCIEPELSDKATEVVTAPIGVEVPQYEPSDNDFLDDDFYPPDDEPILRRVAEDKSFDQDAYKLTLIDCIRATANCKSVPSTVVLDYIKAVLGV